MTDQSSTEAMPEPEPIIDGGAYREHFFKVRDLLELSIRTEVSIALMAVAGQNYQPANDRQKPAFDGRLTCQHGLSCRLYLWDNVPILKIRWSPGSSIGNLTIDSEQLYRRPVSITSREIEVTPLPTWQ